MQDWFLDRFADTPYGVFGRVRYPQTGFSCFTLEPCWTGVVPRDRCIPVGIYELRAATYYGGDGPGGKKDYPTVEIVAPNKEWKEVKFHVGNVVQETQKCPLLGWRLACLPYKEGPVQWGVGGSQHAYENWAAEAEQLIRGTQKGRLTVRWEAGQ